MKDEMNILLVEDNDVDAQILKRGLKKVGHTGSFVRALLERIRNTPGLKETCVFVFTTSNNRTDVDRAYENNANGFIQKPHNSTEMLSILQMISKFWEICTLPIGGARVHPSECASA